MSSEASPPSGEQRHSWNWERHLHTSGHTILDNGNPEMARSFFDSGFACCHAISCSRAAHRQPATSAKISSDESTYLSDTLLYPGNDDLTHRVSIIRTVFDGLGEILVYHFRITRIRLHTRFAGCGTGVRRFSASRL